MPLSAGGRRMLRLLLGTFGLFEKRVHCESVQLHPLGWIVSRQAHLSGAWGKLMRPDHPVAGHRARHLIFPGTIRIRELLTPAADAEPPIEQIGRSQARPRRGI